jgi:hypothetical protein
MRLADDDVVLLFRSDEIEPLGVPDFETIGDVIAYKME